VKAFGRVQFAVVALEVTESRIVAIEHQHTPAD